jgi:putative hydrolase of the HAD superfamily
MSLEAVIFDLDDTLIIEVETARASLRALAALLPGSDPVAVEEVVLAAARRLWRAGPYVEQCRDLGIASWEGLWATFEGGHSSLDGLRDWASDYRPAVWQATVEALQGGSDAPLAAALSDAYIASQRRPHPVLDGADRLMRSLHGRRRLGLLTNGPADIQRHKFNGTGLADCFDAVVISGELGIGKPDPAVFAAVLEGLGTAPENTVMVGDSWTRDVQGALGAGLSAVWLAQGRPAPEELADVTVVDTVADLLDLPWMTEAPA